MAVDRVFRQGFELSAGHVLVRLARPTDLESVSQLFDAYGLLRRMPATPTLGRSFLEERVPLHESVILVADARGLSGFARLHPSATSAGSARTWIITDLFVLPQRRRGGIGRALVTASVELARHMGATSVALAPQNHNVAVQPLTEDLGVSG
jgi:GNAT superfamily N-acetyltransferase